MKKTKTSNNKGITLIALIITIIVMLILVGVTVTVALNGGLFKTAKDAAIGTNKERIKEEMTSVVLGFANENLLADANINDLKQELLKIKGVTSVEGNSFPITVKDENGNEWTIDQYGTIDEKIAVEEVEKVVTEEDEEYSYWKTDGQGTILYYDAPEDKVPETLIIPCQIGDEKITKIGDASLSGSKVQRDENGAAIIEQDEWGNIYPIFEIDEDEEEIPTEVGKKVKNIIISKGIEEIGQWTFYLNMMVTDVTIPEGVKVIGDYAFACNMSLQNVIMSNGVEIIEDGAFLACIALKNISIPEGVTTIGKSAFAQCELLENITIPEGVTTIKEAAFESCTSLQNIVIPSTVDNMGAYPFRYWTNTQTIYIKGKTEAPPDIDNDDYSDIGWSTRNWLEGCSANVVWDK